MAAGKNYERKGDPFTRLVQRGEGPPTVICWQNHSTGRRYCTSRWLSGKQWENHRAEPMMLRGRVVAERLEVRHSSPPRSP